MDILVNGRRFTIFTGVFDSAVTFYVGSPKRILTALVNTDHCAVKERQGHIDFINKTGSNGFSMELRDEDSIKTHVIWLKKWDGTPASIGVLSHEITHYILDVMDDKGIPVRVENSEVQAYMQEYVLRKALEELAKKP